MSHHFIAALGRSQRAELIPYLKRGEDSAEDELKLPFAAQLLPLTSLADPLGLEPLGRCP